MESATVWVTLRKRNTPGGINGARFDAEHCTSFGDSPRAEEGVDGARLVGVWGPSGA